MGNVSRTEKLKELNYSLNGSEPRSLSFKEDKKRLAKSGDFNVEILRSELLSGKNSITLFATSLNGDVTTENVVIDYDENENSWPLPYFIDWSKTDRIEDVAQVVDGKWELTDAGVRTVERHYDRVLAFGDASWVDYEVSTTVTVHALTPPKTGPNGTGVTHVAIATRWPGHDPDGKQPTIKWYPLGATAEFRLGGDLAQCRWRVFDGKKEFYVESKLRRKLEFEKPYHMKHRVETLPDGSSHYSVKLWAVGTPEPSDWDLERIEEGDIQFGSALLLAHHSDVTFGNVSVVPLSGR